MQTSHVLEAFIAHTQVVKNTKEQEEFMHTLGMIEESAETPSIWQFLSYWLLKIL